MEALIEALLELCGSYEPITSAEVLAAVGVFTLAVTVAFFMYLAGRAAHEGMSHIVAALGRLLRAAAGLVAALGVLYILSCLVRAALEHILH